MPDTAPSLAPRRHPPSNNLITPDQRDKLLANGRRTATGEDIDPHVVLKIFTPDANATWLLTESDPAEPDRLFGLVDLGLGFPELGYCSLAEIRALRGPLGLPVERDQHFISDRPLSNYAAVARAAGRITD